MDSGLFKDRGIHVAGDAQGNTLVTGDGNIVIIQASSRIETAATIEEHTPAKANPYIGLAAFTEKESENFFGREQLTGRLWETFRDLHEPDSHGESKTRLLPIIGPSGCGKSSLARAGLIPELARHPLPGLKSQRVVVMTPGAHPLEALAAVLARIATDDATPVVKTREFTNELCASGMGGQFDGLRRIAEALPRIEVSPLIVLIDQFEELYSLCEDSNERDIFVANLLHANRDKGARLSGIFTLRSDFLGQTQNHIELNQVIAQQGVLVPAMTKSALRDAIAKPAEAAGHPLNDAIIDLLIEETEGREGVLPLLEFVLTRIWENLSKGIEPAETLRQVGGVGGALAQTAEHLFESLDKQDQAITRRAFLALVRLGEGTRDTRRRVTVDELVASDEDPQHVRDVLRLFARPGIRLITLASEANGFDTAEVTHESLFEHWVALRQWLDSNRDDIRFQRRLSEAAHHWKNLGRPDGSLWRSPDLDQLRDFYQRHSADFTKIELEFYRNSSSKQARAARIRHTIVFGLLFLAIFSIAAAIYVFKAEREATTQSILAEKHRLAEKSRRLIFQGEQLFNNNNTSLDLSTLLSIEAVKYNPSNDATNSLQKVISYLPENRILLPLKKIEAINFTDDGKYLAVVSAGTSYLWSLAEQKSQSQYKVGEYFGQYIYSDNGKLLAAGDNYNGQIKLLNTYDGKLLTEINAGEKVEKIALSPAATYLLTEIDKKPTRLLSTKDGSVALILEDRNEPKKGLFYNYAFDRADHFIAAANTLGDVYLWDIASKKIVSKYAHSTKSKITFRKPVTRLEFSSDGKLLAAAHLDGTIFVWDIHTKKEIALLKQQEAVRNIRFQPDGKVLWTTSDDRTVREWDITKGTEIVRFNENYDIERLLLSASGRLLITTGNREIKVRDVTTRQILDIVRHDNDIRDISISPNEDFIASFDNQDTLTIWNITTGFHLDHRKRVWSIAYSKNNKFIATSSDDRTVTLWDAQTGKYLSELPHVGRTEFVVFDPSGSRLASTSDDMTTRIWDTHSKKLVGQIFHNSYINAIVFSPDGKLLASADKSGSLHIQEMNSNKEMLHEEFGEPILSLAFSSDGSQVDIVVKTKVIVWNLLENKKLSEVPLGLTLDTPTIFSQDGKMFASAASDKEKGNDNIAVLYDLSNKKVISQIVTPRKIFSLAFSPDAKKLAVACLDGTTRIWDIDKNDISFVIKHDLVASSVAFTADNQFVASGGWDRKIKIWNIEHKKQVAELRYETPVWYLTFSKDGHYIVAATESASADRRPWQADTLIKEACSRLTRNLSGSEWSNYIGKHEAYQKTCPDLPVPKRVKKANLSNILYLIDWAKKNFRGAPNQRLIMAAQAEAGPRLARSGRLEEAQVPIRLFITNLAKNNPKENIDIEKDVVVVTVHYFDEGLKGQLDPVYAISQLNRQAMLNTPGQLAASAWNAICRQGAINGSAEKVLEACDKAIKLCTADCGYYHDSRGIARAMSGNTKGAVEDLKLFITRAKNSKSKQITDLIKEREKWLKILQAGRNPFDAKTIELLRQESQRVR